MSQTFTITYGDQAENHKGMQKIGELANEGFNHDDLMRAKNWFETRNTICHLIKLNDYCDQNYQTEDAYILIIKNGLDCLLGDNGANKFYNEQDALPKDKKALMYGRVVNKTARHNLCFGPVAQEPDYQNGRGTIISFDQVPLLSRVKNLLPEIIGEKGNNMMAEGNYYYDITKCGIGFHGDSERRKVIGVRVGASLPLEFQWFHKNKPIGERVKLVIDHGDIYIFSQKATGFDWKRNSITTLRHAAGAKKFLLIK
jgi:hypothetical protein